MNIKAFILTLVAGLFFLIGVVINHYSKNKNKSYQFSIGMAFIIIIGLIVFDLIPEFYENIEAYVIWKQLLFLVGSLLIGGLVLKLIDLLVPHHHHDHKKGDEHKSEHQENLYHMGIVTSLALILHNLIEGSAIYLTSITDIKYGLLMALGVGLHNIPLGMQISLSLNISKKKSIIPLLIMGLSTGFGVIPLVLFNVNLSNNLLAILIGVTIGMLGYIFFFELFKEVKRNFGENSTKIGVLCGIIILIISLLL